ncbi:unnamed protein product [Kuraishia capsulata CBS 1993]|uniref:Fe2OG dioxygenase domain-containing protein n=1 Tax=Kuraishia capsulata CBS 1993 TaxID=1382522 RepID=W6MIA7_9ASCO|nr:uncharacterized protein KUCA_T00000022001 [Kuraishia capsulata CBS 1993]CDK24062.1 unnamed protein product [Kuraishia capsulata CBS 1993]
MTQEDPVKFVAPEVERWVYPAETKENLDWAELTTIDISTFDQPGGKEKLAQELASAIQHDGFWAVVGHGIPKTEVERQFALGKAFFGKQTLEQKATRTVKFEDGDYFGYKPRHVKKMFGTEVRENAELINIPKFTESGHFEDIHKELPFVQYFRDEIEPFSKKTYEVARKLFVLFALILELPENYFADKHKYDDYSDDHLRYMQYEPRSAEDDAKVENNWARAHTDFGSLTLLFSQVVAGLQIKTGDGENSQWKYVKPVDDGIVCNIGDGLSFWSNSFFRSTIHRVVRPPEDQVTAPRLGLFYFVRPGDGAQIEVAPSPLLKRLGLYKELKPITGTLYVRSRVKNYHDSTSYDKRAGEKFRVGDFEIADGFE